MPDDAFAATIDPRQAPPGDALAGRPPPGDALSLQADQTISDIRGSMADRQRTMQQREQALEGPRSQMIQQLRQPLPKPPQQQQLPPTPQRNEPGADESWLAVAGVLGAIAGGLTRNHATNALAAMTGAMEGYNEGSRQKFDQNLKLWDAESKKILETNRQANEAYTQILQSNKLALEQKSMEIQLTAAKFDDRAAMQLAQTKDFETLGRLIEQRLDKQTQLQHWDAQLRQQHEQMLQRERQAKEANQSRVDAAKLRATAGGAVDPKAIDFRVEEALTGNPNAFKGMRAGTPEYQAFSRRLAEVAEERGIPADKLKTMQTGFAGEQSYQRSAGTMAARVESASNEVAQLAPQAIQASAALPRGKFVPLNKLKQAYEAGTSDPAYNDFLIANFSLEKAYGRAMNPQGVPRVSEAQEAKAGGLLSMATSQEAYAVQVRRLLLEVEASKRAVAQTRAGVGSEKPAASAAPAGKPPVGGLSGDMPVPDPAGWQELAPGIRFREIGP